MAYSFAPQETSEPLAMSPELSECGADWGLSHDSRGTWIEGTAHSESAGYIALTTRSKLPVELVRGR
jgi:hypothetical protein